MNHTTKKTGRETHHTMTIDPGEVCILRDALATELQAMRYARRVSLSDTRSGLCLIKLRDLLFEINAIVAHPAGPVPLEIQWSQPDGVSTECLIHKTGQQTKERTTI